MNTTLTLPKILMLAGLFLLAMGLGLWLIPQVPYVNRLGKLPGDIRIERENYFFNFPIVTCILLSIMVTLILQFIARFKR